MSVPIDKHGGFKEVLPETTHSDGAVSAIEVVSHWRGASLFLTQTTETGEECIEVSVEQARRLRDLIDAAICQSQAA